MFKTLCWKNDTHKEQMNLELKTKVNFRSIVNLNIVSKKIKLLKNRRYIFATL